MVFAWSRCKKFLYGIAKTIVILLAWVMMPFRIWSVYISGVLYQTKMLQCNTLYLFHRNHLVLSLSRLFYEQRLYDDFLFLDQKKHFLLYDLNRHCILSNYRFAKWMIDNDNQLVGFDLIFVLIHSHISTNICIFCSILSESWYS